MDILSESRPKANKEHKCMWCGGTIKIGEVYEKQTIKSDYIYTWINHSKCLDLSHKLKMYDYDCDGVSSDVFMEYVYQYLYDNLSEEAHDGLYGEHAVDKVIELLERSKNSEIL